MCMGKKELPVYTFVLGEDESFSYDKISLVDKPAIQSDWFAFSEQSKPYLFVVNEDKQILAGAFMIPDMPIYRFDEQTKEEYFVMFTKEIIEKLHYNFNKNNRNAAINIMHTDEMAEAYVTENWLIEDKENDKSKIYGFDLPVGTSFGLVKIESKKFWEDNIKSGKLRGFSIEAFLQRENTPINKIEMNKQTQLFVETTLADGRKLKVSEEGAVVGSDVMEVAEDGTETPLTDGEYELEDGSIIIVAEGKITEIKDAMPMAEPEGAPATPVIDVEAMVNEKVATLKAEFEAALTEILAKLTELESGKVETDKGTEEMKAEFAKLSEIPAVKSLFTKVDKPVNKRPDQYNELERLSRILPTNK